MLLSITNIKREYNIRDCEPIIHCKSGSWFRFPKNLFHIYVYHNGKIFWKGYVIVFKTDDPSWWKQFIYDFAISLYAVLPQLVICVIFSPSFIHWSTIKTFYENDYPHLSIFSVSDSFIELTGGKSLHNIPKSL